MHAVTKHYMHLFAIQQRDLLLQLHLLRLGAGLIGQGGGVPLMLGGHFILNVINHGGGEESLYQLPGIAL